MARALCASDGESEEIRRYEEKDRRREVGFE